MAQTKVPPEDRRFVRSVVHRFGDGDNRTNASTTPTWTGWNEQYTANPDHDETIVITVDMMARTSSGTGAFYGSLYIDGVNHPTADRFYTYTTQSWAHQTMNWSIDVDAGDTVSLEIRQYSNSGSVAAQMWSSGPSSHHAPTMTIQSYPRGYAAVTETSQMESDQNVAFVGTQVPEENRTSTWDTTSGTASASGVYADYTAGDEDETVVVNICPMWINEGGGWVKFYPYLNGNPWPLDSNACFYTDAGSHWRRGGRKYIFHASANTTYRVEMYGRVNSGTGRIHYGSYATNFHFTPYPYDPDVLL